MELAVFVTLNWLHVVMTLSLMTAQCCDAWRYANEETLNKWKRRHEFGSVFELNKLNFRAIFYFC